MWPKRRPRSLENNMLLSGDGVDSRVPSLTIPASNNICSAVELDKIIPGIYLTNIIENWTPDKLRSHGFTHIINIDQHIYNKNNNNNNYKNVVTTEFSSDFKTLDLNFGEASYLTTVLPNCYKAVKFIDKALQSGGLILVIDQNGDQKCLTIVIGYLMYKNNITFNDAFQKVKNVFTKAELERFFICQLYEYEPILQVQRGLTRPHSFSGDLRRSFYKRKLVIDDNNVKYDIDKNYNFKTSYHSDTNDIPME